MKIYKLEVAYGYVDDGNRAGMETTVAGSTARGIEKIRNSRGHISERKSFCWARALLKRWRSIADQLNISFV